MIRAGVRTTWGLAAVAMLVALAGCASTEAGFGLPTLSAATAAGILGGSSPSTVHGTLRTASNGCFLWAGEQGSAEDGAWIVWPDAASEDADVVVLSGAERVRDGDALTAVGAVVRLADLPDGAEQSSYFGSFGRFCAADERGVLVLTEVRAAE